MGVLPVLVALCLSFAGEAPGQPLDLTDPKARMISVTFEDSVRPIFGGEGPNTRLARIPANP